MKPLNKIGLRQQWAARISYFIAGFGSACWAPLVPFARLRLHANDAQLGFVLLCMGLGSIFISPLTGILAGKLGCRSLIVAASLGMAAMLPLLATDTTFAAMMIPLLIFGGSFGTVDVLDNVQGSLVEKATGRSMMSGFHGMFSAGGFIGAGLMASLLWHGASPLIATLCASGIIVALTVIAAPSYLPYGREDAAAPLFVKPHGIVIITGLLCFIMFMTEGSMLDWSGVILSTVHACHPLIAARALSFSLSPC